MNKTLRLIIPQWKGGVQSYYTFGADVLAYIAPEGRNEKTVRIDIKTDLSKEPKEENGIVEETSQLQELKKVEEVCKKENPDKIIIFGGDCSVSQGPFDYLSEKYGDKLGIIWLDSHPDISTTINSNHLHEMVLTNILGLGNNSFSKKMKNPISPSHVIYAGLVENPEIKFNSLDSPIDIPIISPEEVINKDEKISNWIKDRKIEKICVHFDLDVLSPEGFRSLTSSKPFQTVEEYGAAVGKLNLVEIVSFLNYVNDKAEIVGLSIAEFVPWDLINLRNAMEDLPIFQ